MNPKQLQCLLDLRKSGEIFGRGQMFTAVSLDLAEPGMAWQEVTGSFKKFIFLVQVLLPMTYAAHGGWLFFALVKCGLETQPKTGATWLKSLCFRSLS